MGSLYGAGAHECGVFGRVKTVECRGNSDWLDELKFNGVSPLAAKFRSPPLRVCRFIHLLFCLCLFVSSPGVKAQYVEIRGRIETVFWQDDGANTNNRAVRCVVGTNTWLIEPEAEPHQRVAWLCDGVELSRQTFVTGHFSKDPELFRRNHPEYEEQIGQTFIRVVPFSDRSPFRPVRVADVPWAGEPKICWLAFCSGAFLRREGRHLFPPIDHWKTQLDAPGDFLDKRAVFEDDLGLPRRIELRTSKQEPIFQYSVVASTNLLGWNLPLEFYLAQSRPVGTKAWQVYFTARGRVTVLGPAIRPKFSSDEQEPGGKTEKARCFL